MMVSDNVGDGTGQFPASFERFNQWLLFLDRNQIRFFREGDLAEPEVTHRMSFPVAQADMVFTNTFCPIDATRFGILNYRSDGRLVFASIFLDDGQYKGTAATQLPIGAVALEALPGNCFYVHDNLQRLLVYKLGSSGEIVILFDLEIDLGNNPILIRSFLVDEKKAILCFFDKKEFKICRAEVPEEGLAGLPKKLSAWATPLRRRIEHYSEFLAHKFFLVGPLLIWDAQDVLFGFNFDTKQRHQLRLDGVVDILPYDTSHVLVVTPMRAFLLSLGVWQSGKGSPEVKTLARLEEGEGEFLSAKLLRGQALGLLGVKDFRIVGLTGPEIRVFFRPAIKKVLSF